MMEKVIENWTSRLDYIRASRGSHMPEIIFIIEIFQGVGQNQPIVLGSVITGYRRKRRTDEADRGHFVAALTMMTGGSCAWQ
ncbi:hypothetical protein TNCV_56061 [Trichonephila clavipes]|nr:hypothetical protein TNCV_56061 [Trichonephila clavipes]